MDLTKPIKNSGCSEPSPDKEYYCRSCAGSDFTVETYFVFQTTSGKKWKDNGIMSGAIICKQCSYAVRIDIGEAIRNKK